MVIVFMLFGFIQLLLDPFLWGITSYAMFVLLTKNDKRWQIGAWGSAALFFVWNELVCCLLMNAIGMSVADEGIADIAGPNMWDIGVFDFLLSIGLAFGGFVLGRLILKKVACVLQVNRHGVLPNESNGETSQSVPSE